MIPLQMGKMSLWPPVHSSEILFPVEAGFSIVIGFQYVLLFMYIRIK